MHHQVLLGSQFRDALIAKFLPEAHDFRIPSHAVFCRLMTLSIGAKSRQQIIRKEVRITVSFFHVLNIISVPAPEHYLLKVTLEPLKILPFPDSYLTRLAVLFIRTFPLARLPKSGSNTLSFSVRVSSAKRTARLDSGLSYSLILGVRPGLHSLN